MRSNTRRLATPEKGSATFTNRATKICGLLKVSAGLFGCIADFNCSNSITVQDIFDFLEAYFAGCG